ncbi:MAG: phage tail sheath family protein, partial [Thiobacillus sp.]|nr:phage tail sheath family protein [Thiobacillus sp.]
MPSYLHPGVYVEEIPSGAKPIEGVSTSVAALVGYATAGPLGEPTLVHSWDEYKTAFGGIASETDHLGLAAYNFFLNGGKDAYIGRLAQGAAAASLPGNKMVGSGTASAINVLALSANSGGKWGNDLSVNVLAQGSDGYRFNLQIRRDSALAEVFNGLSMDDSDAAYALTVINGGSKLVKAALPAGLATHYKKATSVSGDLTAAPAVNWASVVKGATLTLNIDNLGAKTITLGDPTGGSYDGAKVAAEIQKQVLLLGAAYAGFTCTYSGTDHTLTLTSGKQ